MARVRIVLRRAAARLAIGEWELASRTKSPAGNAARAFVGPVEATRQRGYWEQCAGASSTGAELEDGLADLEAIVPDIEQ